MESSQQVEREHDRQVVSLKQGAGDSYWRKVLRRFLRSRLVGVALVVMAFNLLAALCAEQIAPYSYTAIGPREVLSAPSAAHWFGTDELGRDVLSRTIYGARVSLEVMLMSIGLSVVIGIPIGLFAGYVSGWVEDVIMRIMDAWMAFPALILALAMVAMLGPSLMNTMIAIAIINVPRFVRLVRAETLRIREMDYVLAARAVGCSHLRLLAVHVAPGTIGTVTVYASLRAAGAIITESSLSFLGLGIQPPEPSWGSMVDVGMNYWRQAWWMSVFPGLAIFVTVLALNFMGDALRDALDVRLDRN